MRIFQCFRKNPVQDHDLVLAIGRYVGERRWKRRRVSIDCEHRLRHIYTVGSSGSGKTRFAESLLRQDIDQKRAFCLIDPHGDLHRRVLAYITSKSSVQPDIAERLVLIEPANNQHPVGINFLEVPPAIEPYTVVDELILAFKKIWHDAWGDRMADILRNSFLLLQEHRLTLNEMPLLLQNQRFRKHLASTTSNPDLRGFWLDYFGGLKGYNQRLWIESTRNKISAFISSPFIKPIVAQQRSTIDFREMMDRGQICLINLSKKHLKDSRNLLGALIVTKILMAAISREDMPEKDRRPWYLYCDEFQEFVTESFIEILTGARKYRLGVTMLHQNITQPPLDKDPSFIDTILSNAHTQVFFNISRKDAERLAKEMFFATGDKIKYQKRDLWGPIGDPKYWSVTEEWEHYYAELENQRPRECYIKIKGTGDDTPIIATTLNVPNFIPTHHDLEQLLRQESLKRYSRPLAEVHREIEERKKTLSSNLDDTQDETLDVNEWE